MLCEEKRLVLCQHTTVSPKGEGEDGQGAFERKHLKNTNISGRNEMNVFFF